MKTLSDTAKRYLKSFALQQPNKIAILSFTMLLLVFGSGCKKDSAITTEEEQNKNTSSLVAESNLFGSDLSLQTIWELQQAKIATAKYNNFQQAINDGYIDINVIVPEMGYHYLKMDRLNATFEYDKPEILVYSREENGRMKLVALEYAVPISQSPVEPAGFTGNNDHWSVYQGTLWTLHAWVWEPNPAGVFNPTNPNVHLH